MKYEAISTYSPEFSVRKMCKVLGLSTTGYHNWSKRKEARQLQMMQEKTLAHKIKQIFDDNKKVYGYRKMYLTAIKAGIEISQYKIRKIMRENGLYSVAIEKFKAPRKRNPGDRFHSDLVEQQFNPKELNQVWVGDITYIKTKLGWVYLSTVMDLYNREIIGYSISKQIDVELVKQSLSDALIRKAAGKKGIIFHSDRGTQYASKGFRQMLSDNGLVGSMSRSRCPYDNACMESFFSTVKKECIFRRSYDTIKDVKRDLFEYIELFYNRKRIHQSLGYMSPVEYRLSNNKQKSCLLQGIG